MSALEINVEALRGVYPKVSFVCFVEKPVSRVFNSIKKIISRVRLVVMIPITLPNSCAIVAQRHK